MVPVAQALGQPNPRSCCRQCSTPQVGAADRVRGAYPLKSQGARGVAPANCRPLLGYPITPNSSPPQSEPTRQQGGGPPAHRAAPDTQHNRIPAARLHVHRCRTTLRQVRGGPWEADRAGRCTSAGALGAVGTGRARVAQGRQPLPRTSLAAPSRPTKQCTQYLRVRRGCFIHLCSVLYNVGRIPYLHSMVFG